MAKRLKMTLQPGEWRPIKELLKRRYPYLPEATAARLILLELARNTGENTPRGTSRHSEAPEVTCPDHGDARARGSLSGSEKERDPDLSLVLSRLKTLPWFGASLPKSTTVDAFAQALVDGHPDVDVAAQLVRASGWLEDNPKRRKKQLGKFLRGWMSRANQPAPERKSVVQQQKDQQNFFEGRW